MAENLCLCGCGEPVNRGRKFKRGHHLRVLQKERLVVEELFREYGAHGTPIFQGVLLEDCNRKFRDLRKALEIYEEMRRSDGTVAALLMTLELPILSVRYLVKPGKGPEAEQIRDFVEWNLFRGMTITFKDFLRQALGMFWAGFSVFEKVFTFQDGYIKWKKFAVRLQKTVEKWEFDEEGGVQGLWQSFVSPTTGTIKRVYIPIEKLLIFTHRREGSNVQGQSVLRPAYKHWYFKDRVYRLWAISLERCAVGIPVMKLPPRSSSEDKKIAKAIVTSLRKDEKAGVTLPNTWELELLGMRGREMDFIQCIQHHDLMIVKSALAQFLNLPQGKYGSYALSADQSTLLLQSLNYTADYICDVINNYAIPQLVDLNWDGIQHYPHLQHHPISPRNVREVARAWALLTKAGLLQPSPETENFIRDFLGLPRRREWT